MPDLLAYPSEVLRAGSGAGDREIRGVGEPSGDWEVLRVRGSAGAIHARERWAGTVSRRVWLCECTAPAVVLGSIQPADHVDAERARVGGVDVVRRRSGGGAVLVVPGSTIWVEVEVPRGDRLWEPDVGKAFAWLGHAWADALDSVGLGPALVHSGALVRNEWSERVCFVGLGAGEVTVHGRKVLGMSQRRSREGAVFSCVAYLHLHGPSLVELLALEDEDRTRVLQAVEDRAAPLGAGVGASDVESALLVCLPRNRGARG